MEHFSDDDQMFWPREGCMYLGIDGVGRWSWRKRQLNSKRTETFGSGLEWMQASDSCMSVTRIPTDSFFFFFFSN
jgi:hypothetical protein